MGAYCLKHELGFVEVFHEIPTIEVLVVDDLLQTHRELLQIFVHVDERLVHLQRRNIHHESTEQIANAKSIRFMSVCGVRIGIAHPK